MNAKRILELHLPMKNEVRTFHNREYYAHDDGRIYDAGKRRFLKQTITYPQGKGKKPYLYVGLQDDSGKSRRYPSHRVILETFNGYDPTKIQANHIDEKRTTCNSIENLEWATAKENINYGTRTARHIETLRKLWADGKYDCEKKQVAQLSLDGQLIKVWESTNECGRNEYGQRNVSACCRNCFHRPGNNVYKGFKWMYLSDYQKKEEASHLEQLASS